MTTQEQISDSVILGYYQAKYYEFIRHIVSLGNDFHRDYVLFRLLFKFQKPSIHLISVCLWSFLDLDNGILDFPSLYDIKLNSMEIHSLRQMSIANKHNSPYVFYGDKKLCLCHMDIYRIWDDYAKQLDINQSLCNFRKHYFEEMNGKKV